MGKERTKKTWQATEMGTLIKIQLLKKGMTHRELAKEIGTSESYLSQMIYGVSPDCENKFRDRIFEVLEIENVI